jgi:hypothetical protein
MTMVSNHGTVLAGLAQGLLHANHHLNQATLASTRFRLALVGAATAFMGTGILKYMGSIVDHAGEMARTIDRMKLAGWSPGQVQQATNMAFQTARRFPSLSVDTIMTMIRDMSPVLGDREEAVHITPALAQMMRILQIHRGPDATPHALEGEVVAAVRAGELTANTLTDERFRHFLEMMTPAINAWGGLLGPRDFAQAFKYSRAAGLNLSDRFLTQVLPTVMQELGASTAGTSFMTMFQATTGGRMSLRSLNAFAELGLIDRGKALAAGNLTPEGRLRRQQPGLVVGASQLRSDPDLWVRDVLVPALIGHGVVSQTDYDVIKAGDLHSEAGRRARDAITERLAVMFGDRNAQGLMDLLLLQFRKLQRDAILVQQGAGLGASQDVIGRNYQMAKADFHGSWGTLMTALGLPEMSAATTGLKMLTEGIGKMTDALRGMDPATVRDVFIGVAGLVGAITVGGFVGMAFALLSLPGALAAATVALGALAATAWVAGDRDRLKIWAKRLVETNYWITDTLVPSLVRAIGRGLATIPGLLLGVITKMAEDIANAIGAKLAGIAGMLGLGGGSAAPVPGGEPLRRGQPRWQPQNWVPPARSGGGLVPIHNVITIDGHRIADAVSHYIAVANTHVQAAAQYDGGLAHVPVDIQI